MRCNGGYYFYPTSTCVSACNDPIILALTGGLIGFY